MKRRGAHGCVGNHARRGVYRLARLASAANIL
ncbi:hypothetical protein BDSB_16750 [Burkholderia dolosa PC543]|nr:hypothetical protein BDSB_16750 [Burkholderia dolosa PC543]